MYYAQDLSLSRARLAKQLTALREQDVAELKVGLLVRGHGEYWVIVHAPSLYNFGA